MISFGLAGYVYDDSPHYSDSAQSHSPSGDHHNILKSEVLEHSSSKRDGLAATEGAKLG